MIPQIGDYTYYKLNIVQSINFLARAYTISLGNSGGGNVTVNTTTNGGLPQGYLSGLELEYVDADTITVSPGVARSADDTRDYEVTTATNLTVSGDLDTGSEAANTMYYVWLGENGSGNPEIKLSTSATSPTGLAHPRRLPGVVNNRYGASDLDIIPFTMGGGSYTYDVSTVMSGADETQVYYAALSTTWTDMNCSNFVPADVARGIVATKINTSGTSYIHHIIRKDGSASNGLYVMEDNSVQSDMSALQKIIDIPLVNGVYEAKNPYSATTGVSVVGYYYGNSSGGGSGGSGSSIWQTGVNDIYLDESRYANVINTGEQLRLSYDSTNYTSSETDSTGNVQLTLNGDGTDKTYSISTDGGTTNSLTLQNDYLEISGAMKVADIADVDGQNGMIRYHNGDMEGYVNGEWISLTQGNSTGTGDYWGYKNLIVENNSTTPDEDIDITADYLAVEGYSETDLSLTIDGSTTGANGLDTGTYAADTWYYVWVIYDQTYDNWAGLLSTSYDNPTMPSGYHKKRFISAFKTDATSDLIAQRQHDERVDYDAKQSIASSLTSTSYTTQDVSNYIPMNADLGKEGLFGARHSGPSINYYFYLSSDGINDSAIYNSVITSHSSESYTHDFLPVESNNIYYKVETSTHSLYVYSYTISLGAGGGGGGNVGLPIGYMAGLELEYVDADTVKVLSGAARSADDTTDLVLTADTNIDLPTDLDTGTEAANTMYYVWIGLNGSSEVDLKYSTSATSPTGLSHARRMPGIANNRYGGSDNDIIPFSMQSGTYYYTTPMLIDGNDETEVFRQGVDGWSGVEVSFTSFVPEDNSVYMLADCNYGSYRYWGTTDTIQPIANERDMWIPNRSIEFSDGWTGGTTVCSASVKGYNYSSGSGGGGTGSIWQESGSGIYYNESGMDIGIGTDTMSAKLHIMDTGEQLRLGYDASNYSSFTVDASGNLTIAPTGTLTLSNLLADSISTAAINWGTGKMVMHAEYDGGVLTADGTANLGSMTSDNTGTGATPDTYDYMNFYEWSSSETTLNDYDIRIQLTLPNDFVSWADTDAITLDMITETANATDNALDIDLYRKGASSSSLSSASTGNVSSTTANWFTVSIDDSNILDCDAAGETCDVIIRVYSKDSYYTRVGDVVLNYVR